MNNQLNDFYNRYNFIFPKVPDLTKAILATKNVCRNRCNDYMTVLQTIWANDPAGKATGNKGNTENTTQPTQNDQNQNNQNQQDNNAT